MAWLFLLLEEQLDKVRTNRCWGEGANQIRGTVVRREGSNPDHKQLEKKMEPGKILRKQEHLGTNEKSWIVTISTFLKTYLLQNHLCV